MPPAPSAQPVQIISPRTAFITRLEEELLSMKEPHEGQLGREFNTGAELKAAKKAYGDQLAMFAKWADVKSNDSVTIRAKALDKLFKEVKGIPDAGGV